MLYSFDTMRKAEKVPHEKDYRTWTGRLTADELLSVRAELERRLEGKDVTVSSWLPGNDWRGTPFAAIYEKATLFNEEQAAMCFGLVLWDLMMGRDEWWGCMKCEPGAKGVAGTRYFRIDPPAGMPGSGI